MALGDLAKVALAAHTIEPSGDSGDAASAPSSDFAASPFVEGTEKKATSEAEGTVASRDAPWIAIDLTAMDSNDGLCNPGTGDGASIPVPDDLVDDLIDDLLMESKDVAAGADVAANNDDLFGDLIDDFLFVSQGGKWGDVVVGSSSTGDVTVQGDIDIEPESAVGCRVELNRPEAPSADALDGPTATAIELGEATAETPPPELALQSAPPPAPILPKSKAMSKTSQSLSWVTGNAEVKGWLAEAVAEAAPSEDVISKFADNAASDCPPKSDLQGSAATTAETKATCQSEALEDGETSPERTSPGSDKAPARTDAACADPAPEDCETSPSHTSPGGTSSGNESVHSSGTLSPSQGGGEPGDESCNAPPPRQLSMMEVYDRWCCGLDNPEDPVQLEDMLQLLMHGGEPFRSFVQFLARVFEPHRSAGLPAGVHNEAVEDEAVWRSCTAMRVACHAFTSLNMGAQSLRLVCSELLRGLQPRCRAVSMHIAIVLQHLLSAHDHEACDALLQSHAPFVLARALDRPGCPQLLLSLLLGLDAPLPPLSVNQSLKPITAASLQQVLLYLRQADFASFVAASLDSGTRRPPATPCGLQNSKSPSMLSPAPRSWQSPGTPGSTSWPSPGSCILTPQRLATPRGEASPLLSLPAPPSSPSPSADPSTTEMSALCMTLPASPRRLQTARSPEPRSPPSALGVGCRSPFPRRPSSDSGSGGSRCPQTPLGSLGGASPKSLSRCAPHTPGGGGCLSGGDLRSPGSNHLGTGYFAASPLGRLSVVASPLGRLSVASGPPETEDSRGVVVLVEFLTTMLETASRAKDQLYRSKTPPEKDGEMRAELRSQLLEAVFAESPVIPNLFKLLRGGASQFEAANLLRTLLTFMMKPNNILAHFIDRLLAQFLPNVEILCAVLLRSAPKSADGLHAASTRARGGTLAKRELRLNAYTVHEPLGALRVAAVQILASLSDLAPERVLSTIKPPVWGFLVQSFTAYRCNHIFMAACSRLFINLVHYGSTRQQHLVLLKLKLLPGICEAVLAEPACGDRWHDLRHTEHAHTTVSTISADVRIEKSQVATMQKRHPGGLGAITPVIAALTKAQRDVADAAAATEAARCAQRAGTGRETMKDNFEALEQEESSRQTVASALPAKHSHIFIARLLQDVTNWPQVIRAISQGIPGSGSGPCC